MSKLTISVTASGETLEDLEYALEDIIAKFADGNTSGHASSDSGHYTFDIEEEESP